jgi:hypothetical protein
MEHFITDWGVEEKAAGQFQILRVRSPRLRSGQTLHLAGKREFQDDSLFLEGS